MAGASRKSIIRIISLPRHRVRRRDVVSVGRFCTALAAAAFGLGQTPSIAQTQSDAIERSVELVGAKVSDLADRLDSFLANERVEAEANRTRLRLTGGGGWARDDGVKLEGGIDLRVSLPRLGNRLNLFISGSGQEDPGETTQIASATKQDDRGIETVGIGLRYFFLRDPDQALRIDAGVRDGLDVDPFVSPWHRVTFRGAQWKLSPIQEAEWSLDDGFATRALIEADWTLDDSHLFRLTPEIRWEEQRSGVGYAITGSDLRLLDTKAVLETRLAVGFRSNVTDQVDSVTLGLRYRRRVHWHWLELEFEPSLSFPRDRDFDPTPSIFVRLHITFGAKDAPLRWAGEQPKDSGR